MSFLKEAAIGQFLDFIYSDLSNERPYFRDCGQSFLYRYWLYLSEIATVTKVFGFAITIIGAFIGGISVARFGIAKPLIISSILLAATNLFFLLLNNAGPNIKILVLTISADNFALGFSGSVFIAFLSSLTNRHYTASQYALFTSIMFLPGIVISGFSGQIVSSMGWATFSFLQLLWVSPQYFVPF